MISEPTVTVWGFTVTTQQFLEFLPASEHEEDGAEIRMADLLATGAGKICYAPKPTWNNPATNTVGKYIANILGLQHYSVLAHGGITFYIEGISRALSHELIRHRFLGFSQASQRYQDSSKMDWVCPPLYLDDEMAQWELEQQFRRDIESYNLMVEHGMIVNKDQYDPHMLRKRSREAARAVLPNMTETKMVVSGNYRAWRDFLLQRLDPTADLEIMRLAEKLLPIFEEYATESFRDFSDKYGVKI